MRRKKYVVDLWSGLYVERVFESRTGNEAHKSINDVFDYMRDNPVENKETDYYVVMVVEVDNEENEINEYPYY